MTEHHDRSAATEQWPPLKMALWRVLMDERLNDGHYIKAFDLIEKLYSAARSVDAAQAVRGPTEPLQCLRCGTVDAFGPVSKRDPSNG